MGGADKLLLIMINYYNTGGTFVRYGRWVFGDRNAALIILCLSGKMIKIMKLYAPG